MTTERKANVWTDFGGKPGEIRIDFQGKQMLTPVNVVHYDCFDPVFQN